MTYDVLNSVIAGNHDLTLDRDWYLENGEAWHRNGLEVLSLSLYQLPFSVSLYTSDCGQHRTWIVSVTC